MRFTATPYHSAAMTCRLYAAARRYRLFNRAPAVFVSHNVAPPSRSADSAPAAAPRVSGLPANAHVRHAATTASAVRPPAHKARFIAMPY